MSSSSSWVNSTSSYESLSPSVPIGHNLVSPQDSVQHLHRADESKFVLVA